MYRSRFVSDRIIHCHMHYCMGLAIGPMYCITRGSYRFIHCHMHYCMGLAIGPMYCITRGSYRIIHCHICITAHGLPYVLCIVSLAVRIVSYIVMHYWFIHGESVT
jgi:hypothetical protein